MDLTIKTTLDRQLISGMLRVRAMMRPDITLHFELLKEEDGIKTYKITTKPTNPWN